ncbi:hypothetical protein F5B22DRAFT_642172 [Xylaria bambusicola]|uniref:uncharacterized protein n=1 Tax=Xylaria bambusicola TaxID=326684 RepID=UPI002007CAE3|nr:uncharacterized protein F5B22DRAFT_642172 [Xylaria bambusicola]KAI0526015.1 hypothetical protein F5B22DRAFT_642172 [Xylaria bambusicola]
MLLKTTALTTLLLVAKKGMSSPAHTPNSLSSIPDETDLGWTGRIEEDGELKSFTGSSLQHIEAQILEIQPDFTWSRDIEPANSRVEGDIICDISWKPSFASVFHIRQGISYLHKIHGDCVNGPGPGNCSRVSCSYNSGIWFCNDNPQPMSVPCSTFGDRAWDIIEKCYAYGDFPNDSVHGQVFDKDGWNVIVAGADC